MKPTFKPIKQVSYRLTNQIDPYITLSNPPTNQIDL